MGDLHKTAVPDSVIASLRGHLTAMMTEAAPYFVKLTPQERQRLVKPGDKSLAFIEKAYSYAKDIPSLVPGYLDMNAFGADVKDAHDLPALLALVEQFFDGLSDTRMVAVSEAYHGSLIIYHAAQDQEKEGIPGAAVAAEDMGERFVQATHKKGNTETETETVTETVKKEIKID